MRFLIALCLVAVVSAKSGYNYQPAASAPAAASYAPSAPAAASYAPSAPAAASYAPSASSYSPEVAASQDLPAQGYIPPASQEAAPSAVAAPQVELQKEFFTFSANEQDFAEPAGAEQAQGSLNRALRVIFIKGPENRGLENAAVALAKQAGQQETAIYVLNKQADIGDLSNKLNAIRNNNNNKPEVHFVKYRTNQDAVNAQQAIQSQYDQLGGSSTIQNGGVAPVLNFASQPAAHQAAGPSAPGSSYLPASVLRFRQ